MVKVSIIVPVYNTADYLEKCIKSLREQTLQDVEIICIDDGSTDNSLSILNEFAACDNRIKVIQQENKKQGAARNAGMKIASGEYIGYVDSDDWVDLDYYEKLYNSAKKYDSDIALATNVRVGNGKTKKRLNITKEEVKTTLQDKIDVCEQWKNECPTNKIYKKSFLNENNIVWRENVYCEDKIYTLQAIFYANNIVTVPDVYYYYYRNPKSTVNLISYRHKSQFNIDKENARKEVLNFLKSKNAEIRDKDFWATKSIFPSDKFPLIIIKESIHTVKYYLLFIKIREVKV